MSMDKVTICADPKIKKWERLSNPKNAENPWVAGRVDHRRKQVAGKKCLVEHSL
jgi:hypothetical protein